MKRLVGFIIGAIALVIPPAQGAAPNWTDATLDAFATMPIQDGGRIKPLDTYANFFLLRCNGKRTVVTPNDERRQPIEFLLDTLYFPDLAKTYRIFLVEEGQALESLGIHYEKRRDRYSYAQLASARGKLMELGSQYSHIDAKQRTSVQTQLVHLAMNVSEFERLCSYTSFADATIDVRGAPILENLSENPGAHPAIEVLAAAPQVTDAVRTGQIESAAASRIAAELESRFRAASVLALFPPPAVEIEEWLTPYDVLHYAFAPAFDITPQVTAVAKLGALNQLKTDYDAFESGAVDLQLHLAELADARNEYAKVPLEVTFYRGKFFYYSLVLFLLCFILVAWTWTAPGNSRLWTISMAALLIPTAYLTVGIVLRCIIRDRPPVSTLYESILFITAVVVALCLIVEFIGRERLALAVAPTFGALGLFLANKYEAMEGVDTMPSLVAVLDTNFWLATHVTTVTIGYGAGLLASGVAHIYLLGKLVRFRRNDKAFYAKVAQITYGVLCFGLVFSVVGTVLGGIWANYSWGRFWGWDPKENGALLIVLCELAILHFRMGGHIRQHGLCMAAVACGIVIGFSWFGVNLLGIGLHSYGFTSGIARALMIFYAVEIAVLCLGALAGWREQRASRRPATTSVAAIRPEATGGQAKAH